MSFVFTVKRLSTISLMLTAGSALVAQVTTGALAGTVKDSKGALLQGAKIIIESPALFGARNVITDAQGNWHAPLLPPGTYKVTVAKDGYVGSSATNIRIGMGTAVRQDLTMRAVAQASAVVEVVVAAAEVDKSDTKAATNFSAETLESLPTIDRSFNGAADMAPGLTTTNGGTFSIRGGASSTALYSVNGSSVKDDYQGSLNGTNAIEDNIEDVQVILSPLNARFGRTVGGQVNVVTKSGSNDFAGSIRADVARNNWSAIDPSRTTQQGVTNDSFLTRKYQVTLSGPIVKDRIWFAGGTILRPSESTNYTLGQTYTDAANGPVRSGIASVDAGLLAPPTGYKWTTFSQNAPYNQITTDNYWEGKITGAITADHTVDFAFSHSTLNVSPRDPFGDVSTLGGAAPTISRLQALGTQTETKSNYTFSYKGVLNASTFLEARISKLDDSSTMPQGDPNYGTGELSILYAGNGKKGGRAGLSYPFGTGISTTPDRRNNRSANINVKKMLSANGDHEIDLGIDWYESVRGTSTKSGDQNQIFRIGGAYANADQSNYLFPVINWVGPNINGQDSTGLRGLAPSMYQYVGQDGTTKNATTSFYANDQWTINNHWGIMVGGRFDTMKVIDTTGAQLAKANDISPRFQARYDLKGDSKHLFTFTAARFYSDFSAAFTDLFIHKANAAYVESGWGGNATDGTLQFVDYATVHNPANYTHPFTFFDASKNYVVDPNLKPPQMDELTFGYKRTWDSGSSVSMTYVWRNWTNDWANSVDYTADNLIIAQDPTNSGKLAPQMSQVNHVFNSKELKRTYNGLELQWNTKLSAIWAMGGNWTYSRLVGNNQGGDQAPGGQSFRDNSPSGYYTQHTILTQQGVPVDNYAPTGPLFSDQRNRGRVFLTATMPLGKGKITYSWVLRYDSGNEYSAYGESPIPNASSIATIPSQIQGDKIGTSAFKPATYMRYFGGMGQYANNDVYTVDFKISWSVPLNISKFQLIGDVMVQNVLNQIEIIHVNTDTLTTYADNMLHFASPGVAGTAPTQQTPSGLPYWNSGRTFTMSLGVRF